MSGFTASIDVFIRCLEGFDHLLHVTKVHPVIILLLDNSAANNDRWCLCNAGPALLISSGRTRLEKQSLRPTVQQDRTLSVFR